MQLFNSKIFYGPNPYTNSPIVIYNIKIDDSAYLIVKKACLHIINLFPECYASIDFNNQEPKIYVATVLSLLAKHLINRNNGCVQNSGITTHCEGFFIWVGFHHLQVTDQAIQLVLKILHMLIEENKFTNNDIKTLLNSFSNMCKQYYSSDTELIQAAQTFDIPIFPHSINSNYWQFGWGKNSRIFYSASSMQDSYHGVKHSMNKITSKEILKSIGIPTAKSTLITEIKQLANAVKSIGYPCVVKPIRGTQGIGITSNIQNYNELQSAYKYAKQSKFGQNHIMIESFIQGHDYRIMIANGKFHGALERKPSHVIGTGESTLKELIITLNKTRVNPKLNPNRLKPVVINDFVITHLSKQLISLESIIEKDRIVTLSNIASYSTGGIVEDVTSLVHPQIIQMAELIAQTSNIATLGVDYITTDISKPYYETDGAVTEYNHLPSLKLTYFLQNTKDILNNILNIGSGRIPLVIAIINTSKISQVQNWCKKNIHDQAAGWVCAESVYVGQLPLQVTETTGWNGVRMLLRNKTIQKMFIICSDEETMEKGLPVDKTDCICMHDANLTSEWENVIDKSTSQVRKFTDIENLLSFMYSYS